MIFIYPMKTKIELIKIAANLKYPVVQKVVGVLHKTDQKGVILNVNDEAELMLNSKSLMRIDGATGIIIQEMIEGKEVFIGMKKEANFPPLIICGAGGIYVEILKDIVYSLAPISMIEANEMIESLRVFPILQGARGEKGIDVMSLCDTIVKLSQLVLIAPEIAELDINPLMATIDGVIAVDTRIRIEK